MLALKKLSEQYRAEAAIESLTDKLLTTINNCRSGDVMDVADS